MTHPVPKRIRAIVRHAAGLVTIAAALTFGFTHGVTISGLLSGSNAHIVDVGTDPTHVEKSDGGGIIANADASTVGAFNLDVTDATHQTVTTSGAPGAVKGWAIDEDSRFGKGGKGGGAWDPFDPSTENTFSFFTFDVQVNPGENVDYTFDMAYEVAVTAIGAPGKLDSDASVYWTLRRTAGKGSDVFAGSVVQDAVGSNNGFIAQESGTLAGGKDGRNFTFYAWAEVFGKAEDYQLDAGFSDVNFTVSPEPTRVLLALLGTCLVVLHRRRPRGVSA